MEEYKRILIPTDGSERVKTAVEKGVALASLTKGSVTALFVVDQQTFSHLDYQWEAINQLLTKQGEEAVSYVAELAAEAKVPIRTEIVSGHPADEIVKAASRHDLIVMGTLGRTGLDHLLMGSVAEKVMRHAPCPVMVVRLK
ncbi:MAG: universal stress protein [Euryarchaeota archaeon]|nr:universal stress protein [Euryarchaeota archaeon]